MKKITDIFIEKDKTFSIEIFPPKTEEGYSNLLNTISLFSEVGLDFISCTYGAGGGNREKTIDIAAHIQKKHNIPSLVHLTCILHTKDEIKNILNDIKSRDLCNILALRGDTPQDNPNWEPKEENFQFSKDLCAFIKKQFNNKMTVGVAGFPEGHILCPSKELDTEYLKMKIDNGAEFVITQLFFDNKIYFQYIDRLKSMGINIRIIPGILPITNYQGLLKFTKICGATVSNEVKDIFSPISNDKDATLKAGTEFAIKQCEELLKNGAPGIHFYSLNKISPTREILSAIKK